MVVPGGFRQGFRAVMQRILRRSGPLLALGLWLAATPVWAQQDVFVATGVPVDITGDLATLRDQAMMQAQRDAFRKILAEIAPAQDVATLALPPDEQLTSWVQDFEIEDEKMSASRYIGRFTFRFAAEPVSEQAPDMTFDRRWAITLLEHALVQLRDELSNSGKAASAYLDFKAGRGPALGPGFTRQLTLYSFSQAETASATRSAGKIRMV